VALVNYVSKFVSTNGIGNSSIFDNGNVGINTNTPSGKLQVEIGSASLKGLIVKGYTAQTANLQEWQDSAGNTYARINASGEFFGLLSSGIVVSGSIASGQIGQNHLASGSVTSGKIGQFSVSNINIISGTIANDKLANSTIQIAGSSYSPWWFMGSTSPYYPLLACWQVLIILQAV